MSRKFMIEANETLLTVETIRGGKPFMGESPFFGKTMTADHVLDELSDHVVCILRFNTEVLAAPEDITEEVALQYLHRADAEGFDFDDFHLFPAYVLNSKAWARWKDDIEAEQPVHSPAYSTLNHATQGLSKAIGAAL